MIGLRGRFTCSVLVLLSGSMAISQAPAHEVGDFGHYIPGFTMGLPLGAAPPLGLYFENTILYAPRYVGTGQNNGVTAKASVEAAALLWSTGWNFLGANVVMGAAQAGYDLNIYPSAAAGPPFAGATVFSAMQNTWINPLTLSWNFKNGWFASAGFAVFIPDGSRYVGDREPRRLLFEDDLRLSVEFDSLRLVGHCLRLDYQIVERLVAEFGDIRFIRPRRIATQQGVQEIVWIAVVAGPAKLCESASNLDPPRFQGRVVAALAELSIPEGIHRRPIVTQPIPAKELIDE
jgi:hypothetical protein